MGYGDPLKSTSEYSSRSETDIIARMLYSEARGESDEGRRGCGFVVRNRMAKNSSEFGGKYYSDVILKKYAFEGMTTSSALKPDVNSTAWKECLDLASKFFLNPGNLKNPIGKCLWFVTNSLYKQKIKTSGSTESYTFDGSNYVKVVEKKVIGGHTFFRVSGY